MKSLRETKRTRPKLSRRTKWLVGASIAVVAVVVILGGWFAWQGRNSQTTQTTTPAIVDQAPAKREAAGQVPVAPDATNNSSKNNATPTPTQPAASTPPAPAQKKTVTPTITSDGYNSAGQVEIDAYVAGVFEDGGTCTMTATQGSQRVTATSTGYKNVSQTSCHNIILDKSKFASGGTWTVTVEYSSNTAEGTSQAQKMGL